MPFVTFWISNGKKLTQNSIFLNSKSKYLSVPLKHTWYLAATPSPVGGFGDYFHFLTFQIKEKTFFGL